MTVNGLHLHLVHQALPCKNKRHKETGAPNEGAMQQRRNSHAVVEIRARRYRAPMDKLEALLERLKTRQRDLIMEAARFDTMPADSTLKRIAELENAIAAVEAVSNELRDAIDRA